MPEPAPALFPNDFLAHFGDDVPAVSEKIQRYSDTFVSTMRSFSASTLQSPCPEQAWTPLQILEHLHAVNQPFLLSLQRSLQGKAALIMPQGELSPAGKPISPVVARPQGNVSLENVETALEQFQQGNHTIISVAAQLSEEQLEHISLHHGFLGALNNLQVLQNVAWHIRHHSKQLPSELPSE